MDGLDLIGSASLAASSAQVDRAMVIDSAAGGLLSLREEGPLAAEINVASAIPSTAALSSSSSFVCEVCGKSFSRKFNYTRHLRTHSGEKTFKCSICNRRFYRYQHLIRHSAIHFRVSAENTLCSVCGKQFKTEKALKRHMNQHESDFGVLEFC